MAEKRQKNQVILADLSLFLVALLWGGGFIVTKNTLDYLHPIYFMFIRFSVASLLLGILLFPRIRKASKKAFKVGILIGVFLFLGFLAQTVGLQYTTVSKQAFITASNVVMVPFIYWIMSKKRPDAYDVFAAILCFIGIGIMSLDKSFSVGLGDGLSFLCAIFFGFHIAFVGKYTKEYDPLVLAFVQILVCAILSFISMFVFKVEFTPLSFKIGKSIGYMVVGSTVLAFGIQNVAQKYTTPTHAAIILSLESVLGSLLSVIFLHEAFTKKLLLGSVAIFISIITAETKWSFLKTKK